MGFEGNYWKILEYQYKKMSRPTWSKNNHVTVPIDCYNYDIPVGDGSVCIEWLRVQNTQEAIEYYMKHFPFLPDNCIESLAHADFKKKVMMELEFIKSKQ